jgi:dTMP kinase
MLVTFEGIDGAGKTTHLQWAAQFLRLRGLEVKVTREPGGTQLGEKLRKMLLEAVEPPHPETEALLMFAARREHIERVIRPAMADGQVVLCDRFTDATYAYQGGGVGVDAAKLADLERWVHPDLQPDLTLYFDAPVNIARLRLDKARAPDRFERESTEFFERVRSAYLARAQTFPERMQIIDASRPVTEIQAHLQELLTARCR